MTKVAIAMGLLLLAADGLALAQGGRNTNNPGTDRPVIEAPIGHRQPRASDVPNEKNLGNPNDQANKEDAALDKKIKSICRGC
ncbi:hypothetical protein [Bradyrhizobium sp. STM 3557]|uniref:hypothetical protein n=1 Tax=Bradyrhizobium sp. STM 3557 TaxID=578920 RepID=UPI00388D4FA5